MNQKAAMFNTIKRDVIAKQQDLLCKWRAPDRRVVDIVTARGIKTKEEYHHRINNMHSCINMNYLTILRSHNKDKWEESSRKLRSMIPERMHWILEDDFYEVYKMNIHVMENKKIMAIYNKKSRKMYNNMKNVIKDESTLWEYLVCTGGSVTQQNMSTLILACILQCKERYDAIASYEQLTI